MDARLEGKQLVDLYAAVGGKESQVNPDVTPEVFTIPENNQADRNTEVKSAPIIVTGIDATAPIDISGGFYSIDNGPFTSAAGTVGPNQSVVVLLHSADSALANTEATLTIGAISKTFQVNTVVAAAPQPDNFDFYDVTQAQPGALVASNILRIAGITAATTIAVNGGEYAINGGAFTGASGTVGPNQDIQIRATAATTPATTVTAVVTIGGVRDSFHVITSAVDTNPQPFIYTGLINVSPGILVESNTITLAGMNSAALISISGGEYAIDGGSYSATASTIVAGQTVKVRHRSATAFASDSYSTLTIGGYSATFHSFTLANTAPVATSISILDSNGGTAEVGDSLTGSYTYTDADIDPQGATSFRWLRNGAAISGATTANYTLVASDTGKDIQFEVTPRATAGVLVGAAKLSTAITTINSAPKANNILITDTNGGALLVGDSLSASYTYQDADNDLQGISTYRWLRNGLAISGANAASYLASSADSRNLLAVEITPVALTGKLSGIATISSSVLLGNSAPQVTGVAVSGASAGKSNVGASLTGAYTFSDVDGDAEGSSVYKWLRNGTAINGATAQSYPVTSADSGQLIAFEITPIAVSGTAQGATIRSSNITINAVPVAQAVSIVDNNGGTLVVGDALTGTYTYVDTESDTQGASKYRWLRNGTAISGATSTAYVLTGTDSGQSISFEVTPQAATGSVLGVAVRSTGVGVSNSAPAATNVTLVDANGGSAANGDLLNGSYTYSDSDGDSQGATTFRWLRNGTTTIGTAQSYNLTAADSGQNVQFNVTPRASSGIVAGAEVASGVFTVPLYIPTAFTFTSVTNAALSTATTSNLITISGISTSVSISISGGQYSLNGGAFTSAAGTATNGQTVSVKVTSSASPSAVTQAVLNIGGVTGSFSVSTVNDTTPDAFSFTAVTGAALSSSVNSNAITISGINAAAPISITNGQYSISGGAFTSAAGTVTNGQTVTVKVIASATPNTATQAVLTVGGVAGTFSATTVLADTTPDAFSFTPVSSAVTNSSITSAPITISGINTTTPISITGGQYAIGSDAPTSNAGTISNGQTATVTLLASAAVGTSTQALLTVGGVVGAFSATTSNVMGGAIQGAALNIATVVTTLAGAAKGADGIGLAARFNFPRGSVSDGTNLYIADSISNTIRKIVIATGAVTTLAGGSQGSADGIGTAASFYGPQGFTSDGTNLYIADTRNHTIRKIVIATGVVTTLAGSSEGSVDGIGPAASFYYPMGITRDGTNLYIADSGNNTIRKIVIATGAVTTLAGSSQGSVDGTGTAASFSYPEGITSDGANLYITDTENHKIRKIVIATGDVTTLAGSSNGSADGTGTGASFSYPEGITSDGANLYIADTVNHKIRKIVIATGAVTTLAGSSQGSADGTGTAASFRFPQGITSDGTNLYIADVQNHKIRKIVIATGAVTTLAGGSEGNADGTGTAASFYNPSGITTDGFELFVTDAFYGAIRKIH